MSLVETPEPSLEANLEAVNTSMAGPVPVIAKPPPDFIELPRGLFRGGVWHKAAKVRELTGEDEEAFSRVDPFLDPLRYSEVVLGRAVERIGDVPVTEMDLQELLIGERDALYLQVRIATYGDEIEFKGNCDHCGVENTITVDLRDDIPVKAGVDLDKSLHDLVLKDGRKIYFTLATGADQHASFTGAGSVDAAVRNTALLSRCIKKINGEDVADPLAVSKRLGLQDRAKLLEYLVNAQPGPVPGEVKSSCAACHEEILIVLTWANLLRF